MKTLHDSLRWAAAGVVLMAGSAFAQVIRIQKEVEAEPHQNIRLGDLATVSGIDARTAEGLANLVILPDIKESRGVRAEAVLMAVVAQIGPGKVADGLQVSGSATCEVKVGEQTDTRNLKPDIQHVKPETVAVKAEKPAAAGATDTKVADGPTLAKLAIAELQQNLGVGPEDLRVNFTSVNPLLDQATPAGKHWVFRPLTRTFLGTVQFEAQLVDGVRVVQKTSVQMQVLKREPVLIATAPLSRGDVVNKSHFRVDEAWMDRQIPTLFQAEKDAVGLEALRPVAVGSTLDQRDFRPVEMAARGESLSVLFMQGNLKVQMKGVAQQSGKLHDSIQVKDDTTREIYQATLIGKRLAVVGQVDEKLEKQIRETR